MPNITVGTSLTKLAEINVQQAEVITVQMKNNGASALNAFQLRGKGAADPGLGMVTLQSDGFTTPGLHCIYASSEPGMLANGAECILYLTPGYLRTVELWGSVASGSASVLIDTQLTED